MRKKVREYYQINKLRPPDLTEIPCIGILTVGVIGAFLYNNNYLYVGFWDFLITTIEYILIAACLTALIYFITRKWLVASFVVGASYMGLCSYNTLVNRVFIYFPNFYRVRYFMLANIAVWFLMIIIALFVSARKHAKVIHQCISIMLCFLLIFNMVGAVRNHLSLERDVPEAGQDAAEYSTADTVTDSVSWTDEYISYQYNLDAPNRDKNIYYFIFDTMMSPRAAKEYFGANIDGDLNRLSDMGFHIIESGAFVHINKTMYALPELLSPRAYDQYLKEDYEIVSNAGLNNPNYSKIYDIRNQVISKLNKNAGYFFRYPELIVAFQKKGFLTPYNKIIETNPAPPPEIKEEPKEEDMAKASDEIVFDSDMKSLFEMTMGKRDFLNSIKQFQMTFSHNSSQNQQTSDDSDKRKNVVNERVLEISESSGSKNHLYYCHFMLPHTPYAYNADGSQKSLTEALDSFKNEEQKARAYVGQYEFTLKLMVDSMETILSKDPDAVIVITGDHGLAEYAWGDLMKAFDLNALDMNVVTNEIFVALRFEEDADVAANPIFKDPRNIARYLVNTYVGENYAYLK